MGSVQTPGRGSSWDSDGCAILGLEKICWSEKQTKVLPPGRTPHRNGAVPPSGQLLDMAKAANEAGEITCFSHMLWPKYCGDYPQDEVIGERSVT